MRRPTTEVMQIKSGVEIVVKRDGGPVTIRLLGIDTPRNSPDAKVDVLSQRQFLQGLVAIGDRVRLETEDGAATDAQGHLLALVYRASDGLWLNRELVEQGFATRSARYVSRGQAILADAEQRAREAQLGMWAPDYRDHAVQPTPFRAPRSRPRFTRSGGLPAPMVPVPMPVAVPMPVPTPVAVYGGSPGYGHGYGSSSIPIPCGPSTGLAWWGRDAYGRPLTPAQIQQQVQVFVASSNQQQANVLGFMNHAMTSFPQPANVVTTTTGLTPWIPSHGSSSGGGGSTGSHGTTEMGSAGHFGGFGHGNHGGAHH
jgi:endonuclease YncB( thermonuclease family)